MVQYRKTMLLLLGVYFLLEYSDASNYTSNVMKIKTKEGHRPLLKYNILHQNDNSTNEYDESYIPYDLQIIIDVISQLNYTNCKRDVLLVMNGINKREKWALQIFDSSSKFPVGLLHGAYYQFGNFDECVNLKEPSSNLKRTPIQGQYCLADVELFNKRKYDGRVTRSFENLKGKPRYVFNNTMYWGICAPASCTTKEIKFVIKEIFTLATDHTGITVRLNDDKCYVHESQPYSTFEILYVSVIGSFLVLTLLATFFHYYTITQNQKQKSTDHTIESNGRQPGYSMVREAILCFSVIRNTYKFLQTKSASLNLECICGIKFISMFFIISGHTLLFVVGGPVQNIEFFEKESQNFLNAIFLNGPLLVDTFLLISGFLMCYLLLIEFNKKKGRINFLILYAARYIRLTPSYVVVIGIYCTVLYRTSSGPLWTSRIRQEQERCLNSWWTNVLYINNYVNTESLCMFQSWYLAVDYHLFIIAPFVIYPLWKWAKIGKILLGVFTTISIIVPFIITLKDKLDPTLMIFPPEVFDISGNFYFKTAYIKTHMRAGSYFFGLICGYIVYRLKTEGTKISKLLIYCGWFLTSTLGIVSMYSVIFFYFPNHEYNVFESAIYAAIHRAAWCLCIGWVIIMCITDNASLINRFLTWKPFIPLSRLTYCAYLVNGLVENYSLASIREATYMSKFELANKTISHAFITFVSAFLLCILFESPIHGLEKLLLRKRQTNHHNRPNVNQELVDPEVTSSSRTK